MAGVVAVKSAIKEVFDEIIKDVLIEVLVEKIFDIIGWSEDLAMWVSALGTFFLNFFFLNYNLL
ncbi:hypothetical protein LCGC14_0689340 [marine sediment metagenome]|uniref:Uncharacterized protein n=1 Tax=marine sediment metagenome TaxID=412755 RepID=A0A0F9T781_9ZZZZ